jgi:transcription termination factor Rho
MTTRAQLQSKSIDELREVAQAAGIDTDGLQKSKLIAALMDAGEVKEGKPTEEVDLPKATPRTDKSDKPESKTDDDSDDGDDGNDNQNDNRGGGGGKGRQRNRRRRDDERVPEDQLEVREGILDILPEGYGFLRVTGYKSGDKDVYVSANQVRKFRLRKGDIIEGPIRPPRSKEKFPAVVRIASVNGMDPDEAMNRPKFESLTPLFPDVRLRLEVEGASNNILTRIVDLIAPIGKGQRGLIVSPPKAGKTTVLQEIAQSITTNPGPQPRHAGSGRILSGGVDSQALYPPKRFFGAARNIEEGGSLTIMGTALVETGSKMDEVIFEEFKGTGNMELRLDRKLADKRIYPAIDIEASGTRKEELLFDRTELDPGLEAA